MFWSDCSQFLVVSLANFSARFWLMMALGHVNIENIFGGYLANIWPILNGMLVNIWVIFGRILCCIWIVFRFFIFDFNSRSDSINFLLIFVRFSVTICSATILATNIFGLLFDQLFVNIWSVFWRMFLWCMKNTWSLIWSHLVDFYFIRCQFWTTIWWMFHSFLGQFWSIDQPIFGWFLTKFWFNFQSSFFNDHFRYVIVVSSASCSLSNISGSTLPPMVPAGGRSRPPLIRSGSVTSLTTTGSCVPRNRLIKSDTIPQELQQVN